MIAGRARFLGSSPRIAYATIAVFALAIPCSVRVIADEIVVLDAEREFDTVSAALNSPRPPSRITIPILSDTAPPRAVLANAALRARVAQRSGDPVIRRTLLSSAALALLSIGGARPHWGELWSTTAFVETMRAGPESPRVRTALEHSYADAPYLAQAAGWRVTYGINHWQALDAVLRDQVVNEAVWLARRDPNALDTVLTLARDTPAYQPFILRWIMSRTGDDDFRPLDPATP